MLCPAEHVWGFLGGRVELPQHKSGQHAGPEPPRFCFRRAGLSDGRNTLASPFLCKSPASRLPTQGLWKEVDAWSLSSRRGDPSMEPA